MTDYNAIRALTEEDLVRAVRSGDEETRDSAWWVRHWEWAHSPYRHRLEQSHEAVCLMAWESDPPTLDERDEHDFAAIKRLNSFARCLDKSALGWSDRSTVRKQIYWLKREAIRDAMTRGLCWLRLIAVKLTCRTCGGTGAFRDYWDESSDIDYGPRCRRCSGKGSVKLEFVEVNVANRFQFHQPNDHTTPFAAHQDGWLQPHPAGTWRPNKPGHEMPADEALALIDALKRRYWDSKPGYVHDIYDYMRERVIPSAEVHLVA